MSIHTINPATEEIIACYETMNSSQIEQCLQQAQDAFLEWRETSFEKRSLYLTTLATLLRSNKASYAGLITQEMGKPIQQAEAEIEKSAWLCEHYATQGPLYLAPEMIETQWDYSEVSYQPLGVVLGIMPWNFPFWQVFRYAVPTIIAGNAVLLKHAPISTGAALAIQALFQAVSTQLDAPKDLFQSLVADTKDVESLIMNERISAVTFTGSESVGKKIGALSGQALKRVVLELGGNDPYLVLEDADLHLAARALAAARLNNAGQSCNAAKRMIVHTAIYDTFINQLQKEMTAYVMGDPCVSQTKLGPLARADLREGLHQQVLKTIEMGADLVVGGVIPQQRGFYYPPTLIVGVRPGMPAFEEELFGPILTVIRVNSDEEAIDLANQSRFGLGGGVFTQNIEKGIDIARYKIQSGSCFVNQCVSSDPRLPFGGIKHSGIGRELGVAGVREFVNIKTLAYIANQSG